VPIDRDRALAAEPTTRDVSWTQRDVLLYHLSLGAGRDSDRDPQLRWTFERDLQVLPTFAMVAGQGPSAGDRPPRGLELPGVDIDLRRILHAGQSLQVHRPLPSAGTASLTTRVADVWDKGKAAVVLLETAATSPDGEPLWTTRMQLWARGEGGFGGEAGPEESWTRPERDPDHVLETRTDPDQALLYRLNGDLNPLHVDLGFAADVGFDRPILHGLATYGLVAKALIDELLDSDAARLDGLSVRFAGPMFPGETLRTSIWIDGDRLLLQADSVERDGAAVLTHATAEVHP
jgi:acyl dehydratase